MGHVRVHLSPEAFARLSDRAARDGRDISISAGLVLEAALLGVELDPDVAPTLVSIHRAAAAKGATQDQP